jgi:Xaa-Pro dipeptidase
MNDRLRNLQQFLTEQQLECGLITSKHNIFYLSNFDYEPHERFIGIFVFPNRKSLFVVPAMEVAMVKEAGWENEIISYTDTDNVWDIVRDTINQIQTLAVEKQEISYFYIEKLLELQSLLLSSLDEKLINMRLIKSDDELDKLQAAAEYADLAVEFGIKCLKEGISEIEVMAEIEFSLKKKGIREMSFPPVVLFGENASNPHGVPGKRLLQKGDVVLFDLGVKYMGYSSDITRTVVYDHVNEEIVNIYNTVLEANLIGINACKPDIRMGDIDLAARTVIVNAGYGDHFPHRIGHGLGIDVHETPSLTMNNNGVLKPGMVLTVEPGIYLNGVMGVRIEDDVVITESGSSVLTKFPKTLQVVLSGETLCYSK